MQQVEERGVIITTGFAKENQLPYVAVTIGTKAEALAGVHSVRLMPEDAMTLGGALMNAATSAFYDVLVAAYKHEKIQEDDFAAVAVLDAMQLWIRERMEEDAE